MAENLNSETNNITSQVDDNISQSNSSKDSNNKEKKKKTSQDKKNKGKRKRNWIKIYTANVDQFVTLKGRVRALTLEIVKDNPLITFSELIEKLKTRDEFIKKYLSGEVQINGRRKATSQEITIRKILDGMAKEGLILKIQLNDEPFLRFALPEQLEYLRQQGLRIA